MVNESIDLMKLYSLGSANGWNDFLNRCYKNQNINALVSVMRGLQMGMADLEKKKLNDEKLDVFYLRLIKSIEKTAKLILRVKNPNPLDAGKKLEAYNEIIKLKRARDSDFEAFLRKASY